MILKVAERLDFKMHRCEGEENQKLAENRREKNAKNLFDILSIRVNKWYNVDGNTARIFFKNAKKIAEILEIPAFVIEDIGTIWTTLCCGEPIDSVAFGQFCDNYVSKFKNHPTVSFYQFSPTLHKILFHGKNSDEFGYQIWVSLSG